MVKVAALGVVVMLAGVVGELPPPEASYKILMLLPVSTKSHKNIFMALAEALADRGHKIVMLSNHPKASKHPNISELQHNLPYLADNYTSMFDVRKRNLGGYHGMKKTLSMVAKEIYQEPDIMELYKRRKEFDLIIINYLFNEPVFPFLHEMLFITIATSGMDPRQSAVVGNLLNPSYTFSLATTYSVPMSLWQRLINTFTHIAVPFLWRHWSIVPEIQKQDLETWISGAGPEGVIYFSLGSKVQGSSMPTKYRDAFIESFRRLPHRVIWKYDVELNGVSDNVLIKKWLPQQDLLGNNKVKVFITHGGLLSLQEAIYHATPLLSIPIVVDQPRNALFVKNKGLGETLLWEELTADALVSTLTKITKNPQYMENMKRVSRLLRDQLTTPKERAVYWTEYVIRHKGAPQLKCPAAELSWVEFLMLDVLAVLLVVLLITIYFLYRIFRVILAKIFGHQKVKSKLE